MLQPRPVDGRGMPHVLGRAEHDDGVDRTGLIIIGFAHDLEFGRQQVGKTRTNSQRKQPPIGMSLKNAGPRGGYSWPSNSTICSEGMAPCRNKRQEPSSLVRSTMVEGMSRGDWPPSTIRGRQSPS